MHTKSRTKLLVVTLVAAACFQTPGSQAAVRAQEKTAAAATQERDRGIGLYESGDFKAAVKALRAAVKLDKNDGEAWHYLGLALNRGGETKEARKSHVAGTVVLRALPYGLTERSIAAARRIKFDPATKDGHPVSQFIQIEYNFNLY